MWNFELKNQDHMSLPRIYLKIRLTVDMKLAWVGAWKC